MDEARAQVNAIGVLVAILAYTIGVYYFGFRSSGDGGHTKDGTKRNRIAEARQNSKFDAAKAAASCRETGQPWKDPDFGHDSYPEGRSIGTLELRDGERGKPLDLGSNGVTWQPPHKFSPLAKPLGMRADGVPTWLYSDNDGDGIVSAAESMEAEDVCQGSVGDCYFLAALGAVIQHHPDLAEDLIDEEFEEQGIYGVSFWWRGRWEMVYVDGYFPCYQPSSRTHRNKHRLIFAGASDHKEIWTLVVEKAFAKLSGSYEAISGGQISKALEMLTGGRGRRYEPHQLTDEWEVLKERVISDEYFVGAGSHQIRENALDAAEQKKQMRGIVTGHAYTVLTVYEDTTTPEGLRLMELRNPWGKVLYNGDWGPGSRKWNSEAGRRAKAVLGSLRTEKGCFWMCYNDFCDCFDTVDVCHMNFTEEDRQNRAALKAEADRIVAKEDRPKEHSSGSGKGGGEGKGDYTRESADAMMALLLAEDAKEKRMKKNKKGKKKGKK